MLKRKKGSILLMIIIVAAVISILSLPILNMISQNSKLTSNAITDLKANEMAHAGFKVAERYIIDDKQNFVNSLDTNDEFKKDLDLVYNTNGDTAEVSVKGEAFLEDDRLKRVHIKSTGYFGESEVIYEDTVYFSDETAEVLEIPTSRIFSPTVYSEEDSLEKMKMRMIVKDVPDVGTTGTVDKPGHIDTLQKVSNYKEYQASSFTNGTLAEQDITGIIADLSGQDNSGYSIQLVEIKGDRRNGVQVEGSLYDNLLNIDMTSLGQSGKNDVHLIFIVDTHFIFQNELLKINLNGGNVYFISKGIQTNSILGKISVDTAGKDPSVAGQVTIATTGNGSWSCDNGGINMENVFLYLPNVEVSFNNEDNNNTRLLTGGLICANEIDTSVEIGDSTNNVVLWNGLDQILGYNLDRVN